MKYLAHVDGDREQTVKEHLEGTAQLAEEFAGKFGNGDWGYSVEHYMILGSILTYSNGKFKENRNFV